MNPKQKGNTFERKIAESLSLWLTGNKEKRACWRSDSSGGASTFWSKKGEEARYAQANAGDIKQTAERGEYDKLDKFFDTFVVECKAYSEIDFYPPLNKTINSWLDQLLAEKKATGKKAVLIAKKNNRKILYCQEPSDYSPNAPKLMSIYYKDLTLDVYLFEDVVSKINEHSPG